MMTPPCKDCTRRHQGCHGTCEDYKAWSEERKKAIWQYKTENLHTQSEWDRRKFALRKQKKGAWR